MSRIFVLNPNSSIAMTRDISRSVAAMIWPSGPEIEVGRIETAPEGIETQADVEAVSIPVADRIAAEEADAHVIACFSDPGLHLARERSSRPVLGIARSAYLHALQFGHSFGIVSIGAGSIARHARYLRELDLAGHLAGDLSIDSGTDGLGDANVLARIIAAALRLRDEARAEVVILGCAGMGHHRAAVEAAVGVPVVDPVQAAVGAALTMATFGYSARTGNAPAREVAA